MLRAIPLFAVLLFCPATLQAAGSEPAGASRFIPLQLIIGGAWDGTPTITYPAGRFAEDFPHGSVWSGPREWRHPKTGKALTVYDRSRGGRNAADQIFAVRDDQAAIGRVADTRFGISACDGEAKYPLGLWHRGETRRFEYTCWHGDQPRTQVTTITIHEIDYRCGASDHCLKEEWILRSGDGSAPLDHRIYVFAPGRGMVEEAQLR
jgi:hypothetical protein